MPGNNAEREARLEVARQLLVDENWPEWKIRRALKQTYQITDRTLRRDFEELSKRFRASFDDEEHADRAMGGVYERLMLIEKAARDAKDWRAALDANMKIARLLGARSKRWATMNRAVEEGQVVPPGGTVNMTIHNTQIDVHLNRKARELYELPEEELEDRAARTRARLVALDGGRQVVASAQEARTVDDPDDEDTEE